MFQSENSCVNVSSRNEIVKKRVQMKVEIRGKGSGKKILQLTLQWLIM